MIISTASICRTGCILGVAVGMGVGDRNKAPVLFGGVAASCRRGRICMITRIDYGRVCHCGWTLFVASRCQANLPRDGQWKSKFDYEKCSRLVCLIDAMRDGLFDFVLARLINCECMCVKATCVHIYNNTTAFFIYKII